MIFRTTSKKIIIIHQTLDTPRICTVTSRYFSSRLGTWMRRNCSWNKPSSLWTGKKCGSMLALSSRKNKSTQKKLGLKSKTIDKSNLTTTTTPTRCCFQKHDKLFVFLVDQDT